MAAFARFIAIRFTAAMATMLLVSLIVFTLMELVPGNCAERYIAYKATQGQVVTDEDIRAEEVRMGLDRPYLVRWADWISGVFLRFELGESCLWRVDVGQLIGDKLLISLALAGGALMLDLCRIDPCWRCVGGAKRRLARRIPRIVSYLGLAIPNFLLALGIMLLSTIWFGDTLTGPIFGRVP
jgi:peptide/nickel transport system permease protein